MIESAKNIIKSFIEVVGIPDSINISHLPYDRRGPPFEYDDVISFYSEGVSEDSIIDMIIRHSSQYSSEGIFRLRFDWFQTPNTTLLKGRRNKHFKVSQIRIEE